MSSLYMKSVPSYILNNFEIRPKHILNGGKFLNGWYLINILFSLSSSQYFDSFKCHGLFFESQYMIQPGWYRMYLTSQQVSFLHQEKNNFTIFSIIREKSILTASEKYLVYASSDFDPPTQYHKMDDNIYIMSDISQIKNNPHVLKIQPHTSPTLENRYSIGFSQDGSEIPTYDENDDFLIPRSLYHHGLTGKGQVISVSDSGLDSYHCSFYDPNVSTPFKTPNFNHRKIVLYDPVADDKEGERGHGTHVCGILAGKALCRNCGLDLYDGIAPDAKIYMHDLGDLRKGTGDIIDVNLSYYVERARLVSSYILSNSWGYSVGHKEIRATFSKFAYLNPDLTFVFACGNSRSSYTIHTPSNSKNTLAVGALTSPFGAFYESTSNGMFEFGDHKLILDHIIGPTIAETMKRSPSASYNKKKFMVINSFDNGTYINSIVLIRNKLISANANICHEALTKLPNAQLVIFASRVSCNVSTKPKMPFVCLNKTMEFSFSDSVGIATVSPFYTGQPTTIQKLGLSSQGPSSLGYTKPEIVAPGQNIISACAGSSYNQSPRACDSSSLTIKSGTSMATPNAAGILVLVRQFFTDGWYPSLKKPTDSLDNKERELNVPFIPTSTLLRGLAINSAKQIQNPIATGFGVMSPYEGLGFTGMGLRIAHNRTIQSGEHHHYKIEIQENDYPLSITLAYLDPPLSSISYMPLFADLDLVVISPNGKIFKGNGFEDQFQTIEKVIINPAVKGTYHIHILASQFPQPLTVPLYSIVINGKFNQTDLVSNPSFLIEENTDVCYQKCSHGSCIKGQCVCDHGYYGQLCDQKAIDKIMKNDYIELNHKIVKYYQFRVVDENIIFIQLENKNNDFVACINFDNDALKIANENHQTCQYSSYSPITFSFSSANSSLRNGDTFILSVYAITSTQISLGISVIGLESSFSLLYWFVHLPIWKIVLLTSSVSAVFLILFAVIIIMCVNRHRKHSKKEKEHLLTSEMKIPDPREIEHDPADILKVDEEH